MSSSFKVVDLFAGPGGLAEGFSRYTDDEGNRPFRIALSVEKEPPAFATLRLRSLVRQFGDGVPIEYYSFIAGELSHDELIARYPVEWSAACRETLKLELGSTGYEETIDPLLSEIRDASGRNTVLIGGPPCQAYSLAGRVRNRAKEGYEPSEDNRHFLYREYIKIIRKLQPAAFVMENVKGFLSAKVEEESTIFSLVMKDLREAGGLPDSYRLLPLVARQDRRGSEHVLEAERFGIPQCRHRVILFGVRNDIAAEQGIPDSDAALLEPADALITVRDVLETMPPLRSGLSRTADGKNEWRNAAANAFRLAAAAAFDEESDEFDAVATLLVRYEELLRGAPELPLRSSTCLAPVRNNHLAQWLIDPELTALPNHETRSHMEADLARYAFAAVFAELFDRSPKASEFPRGLAPEHRNWTSGNFADRFRVQRWNAPSTTITSHISKDGHYFIHPDPLQCRSLTVREAARLQTFPDNYYFMGNRTEQYTQVGNAVPPLLATQIARVVHKTLVR